MSYGKPQVYINVSQTLAIGGVTLLGLYYLDIQRRATGIQRKAFNDRIKDDAAKIAEVFTRPFRHYF